MHSLRYLILVTSVIIPKTQQRGDRQQRGDERLLIEVMRIIRLTKCKGAEDGTTGSSNMLTYLLQ
jgi:hypothetical protein